VRRRRETAATPHADQDDANERFAAPEDDLVEPELDPLLADRGLEPWPLPDEPPRSSLGPDEQTEPDAPVSRRGSARHGLSGAAVPLSGSPPPERSEEIAVAWVEPLHPREGTDGGRESSLGRARRPERPRSPESRDRGTGLLRGRAPTRPQTPAPQPDAPSLRRARRPGRGVQRDETPTAPFPAADSGPFEASDS
ncbi:MAG: hypothetical protein K0V04_15425, partial [Deltaproteobacteria bacterium]|nr:hypothetical protein [Deltaproteobacteria bacterium]